MSVKSKSPDTIQLVQKIYCRTHRVERKGQLIWKLQGLDKEDMFQKTAKVIKSPTFFIPGCERQFYVQVETISDGLPEDGHVGLFLYYLEGPQAFVSCEFSIIDLLGQKTRTKLLYENLGPDAAGKVEKFVTRKELVDPNFQLLRNNEMTLSCVVTVCEEPTSYVDCKLLDVETSPSCASAAKLQHDLVEESSDDVTIQDIEINAFAEMVRFLSTDDLSKCSTGFLAKLMVAADRYGASSLKNRCESHLCDKVTPDNVLEVLKIADRWRSRDLSQMCSNVLEDIVYSSSLVELIKKMDDLPEALAIFKKVLLEEEQQSDPN